MRVVGGIYRGRRMAEFNGRSIRPTSDRVREAIFNILSSRLGAGLPSKKTRSGFFASLRTLDLFAGTGAMGIEALSRGAQEIVFVESDPASVEVIEKNLSGLGIKSATILKKNVFDAIKTLSLKHCAFDLVFIDPPYEAGLAEKTLAELDGSGIVADDGVVVVEASIKAPLKGGVAALKNLELADERRYGGTLVYFFARRGTHASGVGRGQ